MFIDAHSHIVKTVCGKMTVSVLNDGIKDSINIFVKKSDTVILKLESTAINYSPSTDLESTIRHLEIDVEAMLKRLLIGVANQGNALWSIYGHISVLCILPQSFKTISQESVYEDENLLIKTLGSIAEGLATTVNLIIPPIRVSELKQNEYISKVFNIGNNVGIPRIALSTPKLNETNIFDAIENPVMRLNLLNGVNTYNAITGLKKCIL